MTKLRALVVYQGIGHGFKSPAVAIHKELESAGVNSTVIDFFDELGLERIDSSYKNLWKTCLKYPVLFEIAYATPRPVTRFIEKIKFIGTKKVIVNYLKKMKPDFIVSVNFTLTDFLPAIIKKEKLNIPIYGYNADVVVAHPAWCSNSVKKLLVSTEDGKKDLIANGQNPESIILTSFPLDNKFKKQFGTILAERKKLMLEDKFTALLVLGGEGIGNAEETISQILDAPFDIQVVVVCGRNEQLKNSISQKFPTNVIPVGFVTNMQDYLYCCDVAIGKSGLNFIFEAIFMKKPLIVTKAMANERFGADFVVKHDFGTWPKNKAELHDSLIAIRKKKPRLTMPCDFTASTIATDILSDFNQSSQNLEKKK